MARSMRRFKHNLGSLKKFTADMGYLVPIGLTEVLPLDTFRHNTSLVLRVSPLAAPLMHNVQVHLLHYFAPMRKLWNEELGDPDNWEDFITGGPDGKDASTPPTIVADGQANGLMDYLGIPPAAVGQAVNIMPIRMYNWIWNEFARDQDLQTEREMDDLTLAKVNWARDYFTLAKPWTQKGDMVTLPLGEKAPITGMGKLDQSWGESDQAVYEAGGVQRTYDRNRQIRTDQAQNQFYVEEDPDHPGFPGLYVDLASALGANINDVRKAFAIQRWQEMNARYGTRYTEFLQRHGATPADARLQRPEFLGGGKQRVSFSEVLQTGPDTGTPVREYGVGDLYGHGIAALRSNAYRRTFHEHGYVMTLMFVRPRSVYQDGLERTWIKKNRFDYFQLELQHIGQQEIYNREIYAHHPEPEGILGYGDRYSEYRHQWSTVAGEFRDILDYWHMARKFDSPPALNSDLIECNPTKRIFNAQNNHGLWCMAQHQLIARRLVHRNATARIM